MEDVPIYMTPMVLAWQCRKRGLCCHHNRVQIDEVERRRLERALREAGDALAPEMEQEHIERDGNWPVLTRVDDRCTSTRSSLPATRYSLLGSRKLEAES